MLFNTFKQNLEDFYDKKFLITVSGGVDSMVLASLFLKCDIKFEIAHINYNLRDKDSILDQEIVMQFCETNNITFHLKSITENLKSIQKNAREIRYKFFYEILKLRNLDYLVTAHNLDDQFETFLYNLSRGTGLKGLLGIPNLERSLFRPFLNIKKQDIYDFANENNIIFREDQTNKETKYKRNFIRNKIIPEFKTLNNNILDNFEDTISYLKKTNDFLNKYINSIKSEIISEENGEIFIDKIKFLELDIYLIEEILRSYDFNINEIPKILKVNNGGKFISKKKILQVTKNKFIIKNKK